MRHWLLGLLGIALASQALGADSAMQPTIQVIVNGGAVSGTEAVTIQSLTNMRLSVQADGRSAVVTGVSMTDGSGRKTALDVSSSAVPLGAPLALSILEGKTAFEIIRDDCSGKSLGVPGTPDASCAVQLRAIAADNGAFAGTLRIAHPAKVIDIPLRSRVSGLTPARLSISSGTTCSVNRKLEALCGSYTLSNEGAFTATDLSFALSGPDRDRFSVSSDCPAQGLPKGARCAISVKAQNLNQNRLFSATVAVGYRSSGTGPWTGETLTTEQRTTTADVHGWIDHLQLVGANGSGFLVTGPGRSAVSAARTITAQNAGETVMPPTTVSLGSGANFEILSDLCSGKELRAGERCEVTVRAKADNNGPLSDVLQFLQGESGQELALAGEAQGWMPATLSIATAIGDPSAMTVTGPGSPAFSAPVTLRVVNTGNFPTTPVSLALSGETAFEFVAGGTCQSGVTILGEGEACTVVLRAKATANGNLYATLSASASNTASFNLSGVAGKFNPATIAIVSGGGTGMEVKGLASPAFSDVRTIVIKNIGDWPTVPLATALREASHFEIVAGSTCSGSILQPGGSCKVMVRAKATGNGSFADGLEIGQGGQAVVAELSGTGSMFVPARLAFAGGDGSTMDVVGPGEPAYGAQRTFTVTNEGDWPSQPVAISFVPDTNFEVLGVDGCAGAILPGGVTCSFTVRSKASANGQISAKLRVGQGAQAIETTLAGSATMFVPAQVEFLDSDGTGLDVVGPGAPAVGQSRPITVRNVGDYPTGELSTTVQDADSFEFVGDNGCAGRSLAPGHSCTLSVRARATANGVLLGTLRIVQAGVAVELPLSGVASKFKAAALQLVSANDTALQVTGPGAPAYGDVRAFTFRNVGDWPSGAVSATLLDQTNVEFYGTNSCNGAILNPGATCSITVRAKATANGAAGSVLRVLHGAASTDVAVEVTATKFLPAKLVLASGTGTAMDVVGLGSVVYGDPRPFVFANAGDWATQALTVGVVDGANFELVGANSCSGASLAPGATCSVSVRAKASANGGYASVLRASQGTFNTDVPLTGSGSKFEPPKLVFDVVAGTGMNVIGPATPSYGSPTTFTVKNTGDWASAAVSATVTNNKSFEIVAPTTCIGTVVDPGATCTVSVRPYANENGTLGSTLRISQNNVASDLALSGIASGFATAQVDAFSFGKPSSSSPSSFGMTVEAWTTAISGNSLPSPVTVAGTGGGTVLAINIGNGGWIAPASGQTVVAGQQIGVRIKTDSTAMSANGAKLTIGAGVAGVTPQSASFSVQNPNGVVVSVPAGVSYNLDVRAMADAVGYTAGVPVTVQIPSNAVIGSTSTGTAALTVANLPGSAVSIVNSGRIQGRGGDGANGPNCGSANGRPGGPALAVSVAVSLTNNGSIWGGGGGGGSGVYNDPSTSGSYDYGSGGGGGGAGVQPGSLGGGSDGASGPGGQPGTAGSDTSGGQGGAGALSNPGGNGGGPGEWGANGGGNAGAGDGCSQGRLPGTGGAPGSAVTGANNVTWVSTGDVRGPKSP
jgi:hypothetical protein